MDEASKLGNLCDGGCFGLKALRSGSAYCASYTAKALSHTHMLYLTKGGFDLVAAQYPDTYAKLASMLGADYIDAMRNSTIERNSTFEGCDLDAASGVACPPPKRQECSTPTADYSPHTARCSLLTPYSTTAPLLTHCSLLSTCCSLRTAHCSLTPCSLSSLSLYTTSRRLLHCHPERPWTPFRHLLAHLPAQPPAHLPFPTPPSPSALPCT